MSLSPRSASAGYASLGFGGAPGETKGKSDRLSPRDNSSHGTCSSPKGDENNALAKLSERLDAIANLGASIVSYDAVSRPAKPLVSGEYEDAAIESERRLQWIRYYVTKGMCDEAIEIGWDEESPPDPRPVMPDAERRMLWIKYFVSSWLFEEAYQVGWDEEDPADPRPRRIFIKTTGMFQPANIYRCRDNVRIDGYVEGEAAIASCKIVSKLRFEVTLTLKPLNGVVKQLKIRCDKRENFENLTQKWDALKKTRLAQQLASAAE